MKFKTLAKAVPAVEITEVDVTQTSFDFNTIVTDTDQVGAITKLELIHGDSVTNIENLEARSFTDLLSDNEYTVKVTYTYDLNDGTGEWVIERTLKFKTLAKAVPAVEITEGDVTKTSFDFNIIVTDTDQVGAITKLELIHGESATNIENLETRSFTDLLSNNDYTVKVTYTYDLNDGTGEQTAVGILEVKTKVKAKPIFEFLNVRSTEYTVLGEYTIIDIDDLIETYKVELYYGEELVANNADNEISFDSLEYYTDYTVKITYSFDLGDGYGVREDVAEYTVKTKPYIDVIAVDIKNTDGIVEGDVIYLQIDLDNPLSAKVVSVIVNGVEYSVNPASEESIILMGIKNDGQFEGGGDVELCVESVNVSLDGESYEIIPKTFCSDSVFINGTVTILSAEFVNADLEPIYWAMPEDAVYLLFTLDNPTGYDVKSIDIDSDGFDLDLENIVVIDDNHFYVKCSGGRGTTYVAHSAKMTFGNEYVGELLVNSAYFYAIPCYILGRNGIRTISSPQDLMNIESGYYYEMTCDIDMSGETTWHGIEKFEGVFNGNGYAIKNLSFVSSDSKVALFKTLGNGVIENVKLENLYYLASANENTYTYMGGLVALCEYDASAVINNCSVDASSTIKLIGGENIGLAVGGIYGYGDIMENVAIINCVNYGTIDAAAQYVGGITGGGFEIVRNCVNYGEIIGYSSVPLKNGDKVYVGGISGQTSHALDCINYGDICVKATGQAVVYVGGVFGSLNSRANRCENYGDITQDGEMNVITGGICGLSRGTVTDCINHGDVSGGSGIVGINKSSYDLTISNCINLGNVSGNNSGGIAYIVQSSNNVVSIENCLNLGTVTPLTVGGDCGGIVKGVATQENISVLNCYTTALHPSDLNYPDVEQCTTDQINSKYFYVNILDFNEDFWDFTDIDVENGKYPTLK